MECGDSFFSSTIKVRPIIICFFFSVQFNILNSTIFPLLFYDKSSTYNDMHLYLYCTVFFVVVDFFFRQVDFTLLLLLFDDVQSKRCTILKNKLCSDLMTRVPCNQKKSGNNNNNNNEEKNVSVNSINSVNERKFM